MKPMTNSRSYQLMGLIGLLSLTPGPTIFLVYQLLVSHEVIQSFRLIESKLEIASMISGYSYTMIGFVVAVLSILFVFSDSKAFEQYKKRYFSIFLLLSWICVGSLVLLAILALVNYSKSETVFLFRCMLALYFNTLILLFMIVKPIIGIIKLAVSEKTK